MFRLLSRRLTRRTKLGLALGTSGVFYCLHTTRILHLDVQEPSLPTSLNDHEKDIKLLLSQLSNSNRLREREQSTIVEDKASGIARYDVSQISSNFPCEDDHGGIVVPTPSSHWSFFAVFDGHNGWETSRWLSQNLIPAVIGALADTYSQYLRDHDIDGAEPFPCPSPEVIDKTLKDTFLRLDDDIVNAPLERVFSSPSREAAIRLLTPAYAGSCAILGFYDSQTRLLRIALTGDSRAVLGRRTVDDSGKVTYAVQVLSHDQNGDNESEVSRLYAEHPGEADLTKGNRVMGWGLSRAFGDARMKWSLNIQDRLLQYLGRTPYKNVLTPPYFTAEPVITTTEIKPGDILILASDGLWECLTNEEAVGLAGLWTTSNGNKRPLNSEGGYAPEDLPVILGNDTTTRYSQWRAPKKFTVADSNAATHLIRNAIGGADTDLTAALLSINSPRSRSYVDDITAMVVFFDDE